jgi:hypothetical protein
MSENNSDIIYVIKIIIFIFTNVSYEHYDGSDSKQVNKGWGDMGTAEP